MSVGKGKKVLAIDDDFEMIFALQTRLEASGFSVVTASDGEIGLEKAEAEKPDLIILDVGMPNMDGYTFVRELRKRPTVNQIPVIILSGRDKLKDLFELEGINDFLVKPYQSQELLKKIDEIFERVRSKS